MPCIIILLGKIFDSKYYESSRRNPSSLTQGTITSKINASNENLVSMNRQISDVSGIIITQSTVSKCTKNLKLLK